MSPIHGILDAITIIIPERIIPKNPSKPTTSIGAAKFFTKILSSTTNYVPDVNNEIISKIIAIPGLLFD